jgi:hypothetical protein
VGPKTQPVELVALAGIDLEILLGDLAADLLAEATRAFVVALRVAPPVFPERDVVVEGDAGEVAKYDDRVLEESPLLAAHRLDERLHRLRAAHEPQAHDGCAAHDGEVVGDRPAQRRLVVDAVLVAERVGRGGPDVRVP